MATDKVPIRQLVLIPALITLVVTLLRLGGELMQWSRVFFNPDAGGPGSLVGIVWLVFIFGGYFAVRLTRLGLGAASGGKVILLALAGFVVMFAGMAIGQVLQLPLHFALAVAAVFSIVAVLLPRLAWPELFQTLLVYGLAARIPVIVVMFFAILGEWGTHYDAPPPDFPEMGAMAKFFWIGLIPQATMWVAFTVVVGSLVGGIASFFAKGPVEPAGEEN